MAVEPVWIAVAALGVLALAALGAWRLPRRWRLRRRLRAPSRQLDSFDPDERARGGEAVVQLGLNCRTAGELIHFLGREEERSVQFAIALAVVRANGEPRNRRRVRRLEKWAVEQVVEHGHPVHQGLEWNRAQRPLLASRTPAPQS
jgi:hypothetical protein